MVALNEIQELTRRIAEQFHPDKIILFGSCATALRAVLSADVLAGSGDVDLLVILPFEGSGLRKAVEVLTRVSPDFPIDLIARRPDDAERYYSEHDPLMCGVLDRGRVLYERRG